MADRHLNLFQSYRHGNREDEERAPVLENNVTRALLITLKSSDFLTARFFKNFVGIETSGPYDYGLQSTPGGPNLESKSVIVHSVRPEKPEKGNLAIGRGSVPDAWVASQSDSFASVFENKLYMEISDDQIKRHIKGSFRNELKPAYFLRRKPETLESNQVPVVLWSWRDVYGFFDRIKTEHKVVTRPEVSYVVKQFLEYLEMNDMSEIKFGRYNPEAPEEELRKLHHQIEALGDELVRDLRNHWLDKQKRAGHYLGVNLLSNELGKKSPYEVPHWSLAWDNGTLRLFISCEGKRLVQKLVNERERLAPKLIEKLYAVAPSRLPGLSIEISEKLNFISGGRGANAPIRSPFATSPLGMYETQAEIKSAIRQTFDSMDFLLNSQRTKDKVAEAKSVVNENLRSTSITAVMNLGCSWNWIALEKADNKITEHVIDIANKLTPCYQAILEAYQRETPRRRHQGGTGV